MVSPVTANAPAVSQKKSLNRTKTVNFDRSDVFLRTLRVVYRYMGIPCNDLRKLIS